MDVAPAETGMDAATAAPEMDPMNSRRVEMFGVMSWLAWFEGKEIEQQIANASSILYNIYFVRRTTLLRPKS